MFKLRPSMITRCGSIVRVGARSSSTSATTWGSRSIVHSKERTRLPSIKPRTATSQQIRWHAAAPSGSKVYDFEQIQTLSSSPDPSRVLIDVREPSEFESGYIPTSINIPLKSSPEALLMPADEFEDRFGFAKPKSDQEVVFYCKAGVRSSAAAQLAQQAGYQRVAEYRGSWLDWEKKGGEVAK